MEGQSEIDILRHAIDEPCKLLEESPADFNTKQFEPIIRETLKEASTTTIKELQKALDSKHFELGANSTLFQCQKASDPPIGITRNHNVSGGASIDGNGILKLGSLLVKVIRVYNSYDR